MQGREFYRSFQMHVHVIIPLFPENRTSTQAFLVVKHYSNM